MLNEIGKEYSDISSVYQDMLSLYFALKIRLALVGKLLRSYAKKGPILFDASK